ncbi:MAG: site-specific recombinase, partial [Ilumatobacteraceae bacterium]
MGYTVVNWYADVPGTSGTWTTPSKRPRLFAAFEAAEKLGAGTAVISRELERIGRNSALVGRIQELLNSGVVFRFTDDSDIDNTPDGKLTMTINMAIAQNYTDKMAARMIRRLAHNRSLGLPHMGGYRPFGMEEDKTRQRPSEVALIDQAADH